MPVLTTITSYWRRPEMLRVWFRNLLLVTIPEVVHHFIYFVGEVPPAWLEPLVATNITVIVRPEEPGLSIGHYHNLGAERANTEWIMKLDVDVFPSTRYFLELFSVLSCATSREWFNGGMFYLNRACSFDLLEKVPLDERTYQHVMESRRNCCGNSYPLPAATNFICRRKDYLDLGGCDEGFRGYGWEDYQQIYMLEKHQLGKDPLPGSLTLENVTQRCRDEISRPKAKALWERNPWLCLLHHYHPRASKTSDAMNRNRKVLFDYIVRQRDNKV